MSNTATSVRSSPLMDQSSRKAPSPVPPVQHPGFAMHPGVPVMIPPTPPQQSTEFLGISSEQDLVDQQTQKFATEKTRRSGGSSLSNGSQGSKKDHKSSGFGRLKPTPKGSPDPASGSIYSGGGAAYMARLELWRTAAASTSPPLSGSPPIDKGERHFYPQYKNPFHEPWVSEPDFSHLRSTSLDDEMPVEKNTPPKLRIRHPERSYTAGDFRGAQSRSLSPPPTPPAKDDHWKNLITRQATPAPVSRSSNNRDTLFPPSSAPLATSPYGLAIHRGLLEPRPAPSPPTPGEKPPSAGKDSKGTSKAKKKKSNTKKVSYEDIPTGTYNTDVKPGQARNDFMPSIIKRFGKEKSTPTPPLAMGIGSPWPPPPREIYIPPDRPTTDVPTRPIADAPIRSSADAPPHPSTEASVVVELPGSTLEKAEAVEELAKPSVPEIGKHREPAATKRTNGGNPSRPRGEKRKVMPRKRSNESLYKQMPLPALPPVKPPSPPLQSQTPSPKKVTMAPRLAVQIPSTHLLTDQEIMKQLATALSPQNGTDADAAEKVGTFFHEDSDTEPDEDTSTTSSAIAVRAPCTDETSRHVHSPAFSVRLVPRASLSLHNSLRLSPSTPRADWESRISLASSIGDPFCYDNLDKPPCTALLGTIGEDESQTPGSERRPSESSQFGEVGEVEIHFEKDHLSEFVATIQHRRVTSYTREGPDDDGWDHSHTKSTSTSLLQKGLEAILTQRPNYERAAGYASERTSSIDGSSICEGTPSLLAKEIERLLLPSSEERRVPDSGGWAKSERQTRYLAGRNSEVDSEILFVLRSSEIIPPTPGLRLPAVARQPEKSDPMVHESESEPLEPTVYEPEPLPPVAYDPEGLEPVIDKPEALEPTVYEHKPLLPVAYEPEPEPEPEKLEAVAYEPEKLEAVAYDPLMGY